jgi:RNA polymerase sigma factor (sigma-70 family)
VLVRNVGTIRKQQSLSSWLHGVAARIAHKAWLRSARQRTQERVVLSPIACDDPSKIVVAKELRAALDEEIERLPAKYRTPLVLCYLADKTHEQAARELGWPKSSVTSRLARARELLQRRLRQRGRWIVSLGGSFEVPSVTVARNLVISACERLPRGL